MTALSRSLVRIGNDAEIREQLQTLCYQMLPLSLSAEVRRLKLVVSVVEGLMASSVPDDKRRAGDDPGW